MDKLINYRTAIKKILTEHDHLANCSAKKKHETCLIFDETHDHYLWMSVDWVNQKRINNTHVHIRIKNDKIYEERFLIQDRNLKIKKMNLIAKIGFGTLITFTSLCLLPETTKAQTNQTLGQCINETRSRSISSKEAAELCVNTLKFQKPIQTVGDCINETKSRSISSKEAGQFCQYLLQQQAQNQNRNNNQNSSNGTPTNVQLGGDPQAIADCMKKLMYEKKPVCTRNSCARLSSPEDNANRGFGGWQWQTVRTNISESSAAQACQNAR